MLARIIAAMVMIAALSVAAAAKESPATIVYDDVASQLDRVNVDAGQLWITPADLTRATGFVIKPQGVCREGSDQRQGLASLRAPNFTLPDMDGKVHSLADFRGKKVLLVTWASW